MGANPLAALRHPEFAALAALVLLLDSALLVLGVALSYAIYQRTHDPLALGLVGLAQALPFIVLALYGGHLADRRGALGLVRAGLGLMLVAALLLCALESMPPSLWLPGAYAGVALLGLAAGLVEPATGALRPQLLPRALYGSGAAWSSASHQLSSIGGPLAGGLLYAAGGLRACLWLAPALLLLCLALSLRIRPRPPAVAEDDEGTLWQSLAEAWVYLRRTPIVLYAISLDLLSVLFGGATAILPVFASDLLHAGASGLCLLRAAPAVGALLGVALCARFAPLHRPWRNLLLAAAGFGLAILVFALSHHLWLSLLALAVSGASDSVSMVIRGALLQAVPPEHLRGRVMAVNSVFIGMSSELGAFESGLAARLLGTVPSVVAGAAICGGVVLGLWSRSRALFAFRLHADTAIAAIMAPCPAPSPLPGPGPNLPSNAARS